MVRKFSSTYPGRMLLFTLFLTITVGAFLLSLPICQKVTMPFFDMFFVSCSMTCVTGLTTVPLENFTRIGQIVLLGLLQLGGLGIMTMMLTVLSLFINMGLTTQLLAGHILEIDNLRQIKRMFIFTLMCTFCIEFIGFLLLIPIFLKDFAVHDAIFYALFHAISSFSNAGVCLFPQGMLFYQQNSAMLLVTSWLIFMGGFGFIGLHELLKIIRSRFYPHRRHHQLSLTTKIIIATTFLIIATSTVIFFLLESANTLRHLSLTEQLVNSLFNAISMRSVGLLTVEFNTLQLSSILLIMIISFIGSAPGSTGSGIKTTVFTLFLATVKAVLLGKKQVSILHRTISTLQIYKSLSILTLSMSCITISTFFLLITENSGNFLDIIFEATSAFVNLGISSGITQGLTQLGKIFIIINMIFGRIGSLTLTLAFIKNRDTKEFSYPEEKVMLS